jgi:hypothetical protein
MIMAIVFVARAAPPETRVGDCVACKEKFLLPPGRQVTSAQGPYRGMRSLT